MSTPDVHAQCFEDHVMQTVHDAMSSRQEHLESSSHLMWLYRQYYKVLVRTLELDRREADIARREAALTRTPRKSRGARNHGDTGGGGAPSLAGGGVAADGHPTYPTVE